ncbi:MAG: TetR/AcrR family transcriptional regulator [Clostridia bacterium]|nr:TetR/AcrR family transcriptional regulator [Clostridia bacterium]
MKANATSQEQILAACRALTEREGIGAISMRAVAGECGIALGTLYHYYVDKEALLLAAVEDIWRDILPEDDADHSPYFAEYAEMLYRRIRQGISRYPGFLTAHSAVFAGADRQQGREAMHSCFGSIRRGLAASIAADSAITPGVLNDGYTAQQMADFVLDNMLMLLMKGAPDCGFLIRTVTLALHGKAE